MKEEQFRAFQRQELTITFANGRPLTAPIAHWVGAILTTLSQADLHTVVEKVLLYRDQPPIARAQITLPPSHRDLENTCNGR